MRITVAASQIATWLDSGYRLGAGEFTYSIPTPESTWASYDGSSETTKPGFGLPDTGMANAFSAALALWDDLIAPDFSLMPDTAASRGVVRIAVTDMSDTQTAYAYYPTSFGNKPGDIWFNAEYGPWDWSKGGFDFYSMIHELGHAVGLEHSFEAPAAPAQFESHRYTVMSYTPLDDYFVNFDWQDADLYATFQSPEPETPMVLDIAAIQTIYGADRGTRAGDTTFRFEPWTPALQTIYDAGGNDTLDLSDFTLSNRIDLDPGAYSSVGMASVDQQIAYWTDRNPGDAEFIEYIFDTYMPAHSMTAYTFTDNVAIALSTVIENAIGGSGDDTIFGNGQDNRLIGNAGNDVLVGRGGSDWIEGGDGNDILRGDGDGTARAQTSVAAPVTLQSDPMPAPVGLLIGTAPPGGSLPAGTSEVRGGLQVTHGLVTGSLPGTASPNAGPRHRLRLRYGCRRRHLDRRRGR